MSARSMRLLTHNVLKCNAKGAERGFPLQLQIDEYEVRETDINYDFLKDLLPTLHWPGVVICASAVGLEGFPVDFDPSLLESEDFLNAVHNLLLDIHVKNGVLLCPETGSKFPINNFIPNMKLNEDDVQ